jgi:radical SAM protein with 4Fe4S-binding SPASM domain
VFDSSLRRVIGEHFQWVRFSVDTIIEENYTAGKGRNAVRAVMKNVESLHKEHNLKVGVNCNVGKFVTIEDAESLVNWVEGGSASYLQFRPVLPRRFKPNETPSLNATVWEYLNSIKGKPFLSLSDDKRGDIEQNVAFPFRSCEGHFFEPILDATGEIKACMYFPGDSRFAFGSIYESTLPEIWASERRRQTIEFVRRLDYGKNCQICCKLTEPNKLLDLLLRTDEIPDRNFL